MKKLISIFSLIAFMLLSFNSIAKASSEDAKKFDHYRQTIKKEFNIDISQYKEKLKGGRADGKPITKYDLNQLIMGIKVELEHTKDKMTALEIATDHLEEFPDYYTRLLKMEEEAEKELKHKK